MRHARRYRRNSKFAEVVPHEASLPAPPRFSPMPIADRGMPFEDFPDLDAAVQEILGRGQEVYISDAAVFVDYCTEYVSDAAVQEKWQRYPN